MKMQIRTTLLVFAIVFIASVLFLTSCTALMVLDAETGEYRLPTQKETIEWYSNEGAKLLGKTGVIPGWMVGLAGSAIAAAAGMGVAALKSKQEAEKAKEETKVTAMRADEAETAATTLVAAIELGGTKNQIKAAVKERKNDLIDEIVATST